MAIDLETLRKKAREADKFTPSGGGGTGIVLACIGFAAWLAFRAPNTPTPAPAPIPREAPIQPQAQAPAATLDARADPGPTTAPALASPAAADLDGWVEQVTEANRNGIESALAVAQETTDGTRIALAAGLAGNGYDFSSVSISRNRVAARASNKQARDMLDGEGDVGVACKLLDAAFAEDPMDVEVAGNVAICRFKLRQYAAAQRYAIYALSLPGGATKKGSTTSWTTLAATYAADGDAMRAQSALFVTLATVTDAGVRCAVAISSVDHMYGTVMRSATIALLDRARALYGLQECQPPDQWRLAQ